MSLRAIDAVVNIWTPEALAGRPDVAPAAVAEITASTERLLAALPPGSRTRTRVRGPRSATATEQALTRWCFFGWECSARRKTTAP